MTRVFTFNPMLVMMICGLIHTAAVAVVACLPPGFKPSRERSLPGYLFARQWALGALSIAGIMFVDAGLGWFWAGWSMADWRFQLPSVLLLLFIGTMYVAMFLRKASWADVALLLTSATAYAVMIHVWVPAIDLMAFRLMDGLPLFWAATILAHGALAAVKIFAFRHRSGRPDPAPLSHALFSFAWDKEAIINRIFNRKVIAITWVLATLQFMLVFNGLSLFIWW